MPEAVEGKKKVDRVIDICGTSPKGTGLQNLRECIIETKWKYDVAPEEKQVVWKRMILNFMERWVVGGQRESLSSFDTTFLFWQCLFQP